MIDLSLFGAAENDAIVEERSGEDKPVKNLQGDSEMASAARNGLVKREVVYPRDYRLSPDEIKSYSVRVDGEVINIAFHNWHELYALCQKLNLGTRKVDGQYIRELEDDEMREFLKSELGSVSVDERIHVVRPDGYLSHGERRAIDHKGVNRRGGMGVLFNHRFS